MEYNNDAPSPIHDIDTDVYMAKSGRLAERPVKQNNTKEWQYMKGHVNEVQSHLLAAIEPLLTRIQMLESDVAELTQRLNKKLEDFGAPTFDSKLDDIAQHYVEQHFERMQADDITGFEDAVYDIVDAYGIEHKVEEVIEHYDFEDIVAEYQGSNFVEQNKRELVNLWRDMLHNLRVTYDD
jgi:hypothetical protein